MKCYDFAVFSNIWILKVVLGYKKWSKIAEIVDSQRKIVKLSNDMSDVFVAFLEMKCDYPYPTLFKWGEFMDSCEGCSLKTLENHNRGKGSSIKSFFLHFFC